jgi:hypothetical protein
MTEGYSRGAVVGRALLGLAAGAVLGLMPQLISLGDGSQEGISLIGPVLGGLLVGAFAVAIGDPEVRPLFRCLVIGVLAGIVIGAFGGAFVWAPLKTWAFFGDESWFPETFAEFQRIGFGLGAVMGFVAGLLAGGVAWLCQRGEIAIEEGR